MRLFIGIGLPLSVGETLSRAAHTLLPLKVQDAAPIRWTRPEDMHLTLSFLGSVEPSRLEEIQQSLAPLHADLLYLQLNGVGIFPHTGALHAKVKLSAILLIFAEQVFRAMEGCGFVRERRPYTPHITLARSKGLVRFTSGREVHPAFRQAFEVRGFFLYQSFTRPDGARYEVLRAFPLV
jgi:2'-5' RNA ligase